MTTDDLPGRLASFLRTAGALGPAEDLGPVDLRPAGVLGSAGDLGPVDLRSGTDR